MKRIIFYFFILAAAVQLYPDAEIIPFPKPDYQNAESIDFALAARMAIENSSELRNEYTSRALSEGAWLWGARAYLPKLSIVASEDDRLSQIGADSFLKNYSVNLDQLLWDGGKISLARKMEKAELDFALDKLKQIASSIADDAISSYRDVLQGRMILDIKERTLESLTEQQRIMLREAELGMIRQVDLTEAEITIALEELDFFSLSMDLEEMEWILAKKLGLEMLPELSEKIDTGKTIHLPSPEVVSVVAESRNPDIAAFRFSILKRQAELKAASLSWVPQLRLTGSFAVSGRHYPLSRYSWSVGLSVDFSSPWLSGNFAAQTGGDPPYDRNARLQQTANPLPNPAASFSVRQAELALANERSRYETLLKDVHAAAERGIKECKVFEKKRDLAMNALELEWEKFRLTELRMSLGELTRLDLMGARLDYSKREAALVEAASALLRAERELERLLDMAPGELSAFFEVQGL